MESYFDNRQNDTFVIFFGRTESYINYVKKVPCKCLMIKGTYYALFDGINGVEHINTILSIKYMLEDIINYINPSHIYMVGSSIAGHSALLFGLILDIDKKITVYAMNPIIVLHPKDHLRKNHRLRIIRNIVQFLENNEIYHYFDITKLEPRSNVTINLITSRKSIGDLIRSKRLKKSKLKNILKIKYLESNTHCGAFLYFI